MSTIGWIILIIVLIMLFGGGGGYYWTRRGGKERQVRLKGRTTSPVLGIVRALFGGFHYSVIRGPSVAPFSLESHNWYGWIVAILGAMLLVWVYPFVFPRKWWN